MPPPPPESSPPTPDSKSIFHPATLFQTDPSPSPSTPNTKPHTSYAIIILNQPINATIYTILSRHASLILCADGGANHWHDQFYRPAAPTSSDVVNDAARPGVDHRSGVDGKGATHANPSNDDGIDRRNASPRRRSTSNSVLDTDNTQPNNHSLTSKTTATTELRLPDAIIGDLDSLRPDVRQTLSAQGVEVIEDGDQYSTDFEKCLKHVRSWGGDRRRAFEGAGQDDDGRGHGGEIRDDNDEAGKDTRLDVVVLSTLSGRVDQAMSTLHHLYTAKAENGDNSLNEADNDDTMTDTTQAQAESPPKGARSEEQQQRRQSPHLRHGPDHLRTRRKVSSVKLGQIYLLTPSSLSFILEPGVNEIHFPSETIERVEASPDDTTTSSPESSHPAYPPLFTANVGILPLSEPCLLTTSSLEWDVVDWHTSFGVGMLSSSNHVVSSPVTINVGFEDDEAEKKKRRGPLFTIELAEWLRGDG